MMNSRQVSGTLDTPKMSWKGEWKWNLRRWMSTSPLRLRWTRSNPLVSPWALNNNPEVQ